MPHFDAISLVTDDMSRTLAFYRLLDLTFPTEADGEPHVEAELPNGMRLMWDTVAVVESFDPAWTPATGGHRAALAFRCADAADVDAVYARVIAGGFAGHLEPWDAFWGQRYAVLHDPNGTPVDLYAPLA